ncbi:MAG: hypothetical protein AAFR35_16770 [Pseudomonadota bacterium]
MKIQYIAALFAATALAVPATESQADTWEVTVQNTLSEEYVTQFVLAPVEHDSHFFDETGSLTYEARALALQGLPYFLAGNIGPEAIIGNGPDKVGSLPGRTLPGNTGSFTMETEAGVVRFMSMVSTQNEPDNYVMGIVDLAHSDEVSVPMQRFDLGENEGRDRHAYVSSGEVLVTFRRLN